MKLICISSLLIIATISEYCLYGGFTENDNGKCKFRCGSDDYLDIDDLSFDLIKDQCPSVAAATEINSDCKTLDDLVYADGICECPYCKCSTEDTEGEYSEIFRFEAEDQFTAPAKGCFNCTCVDWSSSGYFDKGTMINVCNDVGSTADPTTWNDYKCPPTECEASTSGYDEIVYGGEYWYEDVGDSDTKCEKFCYCDGDDGKVCKTGFSNIVKDDKLVDYLRTQCAYDGATACYDMSAESFDGSRLFTSDVGPECNGYCPKCDCDGNDVGDTWYVEFQDDFDAENGYASCAVCTCIKGGYSSGGNNYASCNYLDYYQIGDGDCPQKNDEGGLSCYSDDYSEGGGYYGYYGYYGGGGYDWDNSGGGIDWDNWSPYDTTASGSASTTDSGLAYTTDSGLASTTLSGSTTSTWNPIAWDYGGEVIPRGDRENCTGDSDLFGSSIAYCEWSKSKYSYDTWSGDEYRYSWGCGVGALCEAFMENDKCFYADFEYTATDCYGNEETERITEYRYCCKTDNCNEVDIDTSSCDVSTEFEDLYKGYRECLVDTSSAIYKFGCDNDIDKITCSDLLEIFGDQAGCLCDVFGGLYPLVSSDSQDILQEDANRQMEQFSSWNDALGCNINIECKLSEDGGVLENNGDVLQDNSARSGLIYCSALMWALLTMMYIL